MTNERPNLSDYIEKWSRKYLVPHEQERSAREEYANDLSRWHEAQITQLRASVHARNNELTAARLENERLQEVLTIPNITPETTSSAMFIRTLSEHEKGQPVNTQDLINALMWRVKNQRKEIARLLARGDKAELELNSLKTHYARRAAAEPGAGGKFTYDVVAYNESWGGYGDNASKEDFESAEEAIEYAKSCGAHLNAAVYKRTIPIPVERVSVKIYPTENSGASSE